MHCAIFFIKRYLSLVVHPNFGKADYNFLSITPVHFHRTIGMANASR